jgi:tRNA 2-thiouridine synthesizing protein B
MMRPSAPCWIPTITSWVSEMLLHTLSRPPGHPAFQDCLRLLAPGDSLLLLSDGVYAALAGSEAASALADSGAEVLVLAADAGAAGVAARLSPAVTTVDYAGFVELSERYSRQQAWY